MGQITGLLIRSRRIRHLQDGCQFADATRGWILKYFDGSYDSVNRNRGLNSVAVCGTDRDIRCSCPNVQTSQLRPVSGRSQFEVSEAPLFADDPHVGRQHGQHLLVGPAVLRPPGNGVNGKRMSQILQARRQRAVLSADARGPSKPGKGWPQHEVR